MNYKKIRFIMIILLIIFAISSLFIGAYDVTLSTIIDDPKALTVLLDARLPRLLAILCTGVGMSIGGLIMQNLCANKFISPTTGATISSAQLGIIVALTLIPNATLSTRTLFAFASAILGTWLFVGFVQKIKLKDIIMVPLIGIMFNSVIGGVVSYIAYENDLTQILSNMLVGDFALILSGRYEIVFLVVPLIIIAYIFANHFNIVGMGENFSTNLGVNYNLIMFGGLTIVAIISASVVVTVGTVSYIGLIVPNIITMFKGDKIRKSLADVGLFGALFVLICDVIGRSIMQPYELPIELISGIIGSLLFIILLFKRLNPQGKYRRKRGKVYE